MLVLNLPFKALMFLTLMRPSLVLFLVLWLKLVKDFLKVRCRLALLPFLISCLIWLDFLNGRFNTSITHAYSIVIGSKHITLNATGGGFLTASKQFRHGATSKSRSNTASNST